jgi:hypothetical protein
MEKRKEILNELEELSPILFKLKTEGADKNIEVPKGYFESIVDQFLERQLQLENLITSDIPKDYFDNVESAVFAKIKTMEQDEDPLPPKKKIIDISSGRERVRLSFLPLLTKIAIAATLFFFFIKGTDYFKSNQIEEDIDYLASISKAEALNYIAENTHEFETEQLVGIEFKEEIKNVEEITSEELNSYLYENINQLNEEDFSEIF